MRSMIDEKPKKWKARDGFFCGFVLIFLSIIINAFLRIVYQNYPGFADWFKANERFAQGVLLLVRSSSWVLTVFVLARIQRTDDNYLDPVGLKDRPTLSGWLYICVAIGISLLALYGVTRHWIPPSQLSRSYHYQGGAAEWFFVGYAVLIAPFSEEVVMRGFLYRAFRGSYNPYLSILFVLCFHSYFHWGLIQGSPFTFVCLAAVEILLCLAREWTGSLWNCILCHSTYNAVQNLPWYFVSLCLILYLLWFLKWQIRLSTKEISRA